MDVPESPASGVQEPRSQMGLMTSPPRELDEPFEDEAELIGGGSVPPMEAEEADGEELFGDNLEA